jgi:hypothetical protein
MCGVPELAYTNQHVNGLDPIFFRIKRVHQLQPGPATATRASTLRFPPEMQREVQEGQMVLMEGTETMPTPRKYPLELPGPA